MTRVPFSAGAKKGYFLFTTMSRPALRPTQPCIQGVKWLGYEADHLPPSAQVKNVWCYFSTVPYVFMAQYLISTGTTLPSPYDCFWYTDDFVIYEYCGQPWFVQG